MFPQGVEVNHLSDLIHSYLATLGSEEIVTPEQAKVTKTCFANSGGILTSASTCRMAPEREVEVQQLLCSMGGVMREVVAIRIEIRELF